jgi:dienelactone hydrolase
MKDEFSYIVPTGNAGNTQEIWDAEGNVLTEMDSADLNESVNNGGAGRGGRGGAGGGDGRRSLAWRGDGGPGFIFLQLEPAPEGEEGANAPAAGRGAGGRGAGGRGAANADRADRVMHWLPPFDSTDVEVVYTSPTQINSMRFDETNRKMFLTRSDDGDQTIHMVDLDNPGQEVLVLDYEEPETEDDAPEDLSGMPGALMGSGGGGGGRGGRGGGGGGGAVRVASSGQHVYFQGTERYEDDQNFAPRPWVDRVEVGTGERERIWQSSADVYETLSTPLDSDLNQVIIQRQSRTSVPQNVLVDRAAGTETQLTQNIDFTPDLTAARRESFMVTRPDGFQSRVRVTLPHDFVDGQDPLPGMFWFYPREYENQESYDSGLGSENINQFQNISVRDMDILTLHGYVIVEPDVPIVGPDGQRNDEYVHDLRNTLATVIDSISAKGWVDRDRLGIGGHSYGAFSTAHAMIQTPFFKAGIAGDGNYNRTLTPGGFQSEQRDLWEAQQLYVEMSPYFQIDRISGALLMYHGMDDHNVGTHPINSERLFLAMEILGKTASLYMYPFEDHGPATRETNLDLWARWVEWLDVYVKNANMKIVSDQEAELFGGR